MFQRWFGMMRPHAGEAIGLQLDPHLQAVGGRLAAGGALRRRHLRQHAEQVLHVMADLMRDHIGFRELAGLAAAAVEAHLHVVEERGVEIDALVARTIERPHGGAGKAAAAVAFDAAVEHQARRPVAVTARLEDVAPDVLGIADNGGDKIAGAVARRAGARRGLPGKAAGSGVAVLLSSSAPPMSTPGSMPSAQPTRPSTTTAPIPRPPPRRCESHRRMPYTAAAVAVVFDIVAAAKIIPAHSKSPHVAATIY